MKLDLNTISSGSKIFNGGVAGVVGNTTVDVEKKKSTDPDTYPDFKLIVKDKTGNTINQGFYYPADDWDQARLNRELSRVISAARAVVGDDYEFPDVESPKHAYDTLFKIIAKEAGDKKFSVFVTYGSKGYPSKYLGLRYFNFIEPMSDKPTLQVTPNDLLERVQEDAPKGATKSTEDGEDQDWF